MYFSVARERLFNAYQLEPLTKTEKIVLRLMEKGLSNQAIAETRIKGIKTIEQQVSSILSKLNAANRTEAVYIARQLGLL